MTPIRKMIEDHIPGAMRAREAARTKVVEYRPIVSRGQLSVLEDVRDERGWAPEELVELLSRWGYGSLPEVHSDRFRDMLSALKNRGTHSDIRRTLSWKALGAGNRTAVALILETRCDGCGDLIDERSGGLCDGCVTMLAVPCGRCGDDGEEGVARDGALYCGRCGEPLEGT